VIVSPRSNIACDANGRVVGAAVRDVLAWDLRKGEATKFKCDPTAPEDGAGGECVFVALGDDGKSVAAAYGSGLVRVWRGDDVCVFEGHRAAPTALRWCPGSALLCSGGANGDVVLWDAVAERGLARLRGHKAQCADVAFLGDWADAEQGSRLVVSASKDTTTKVWDANTKDCIQTISFGGDADTACRCLDVDAVHRRLATGGADLQLWAVSERWGDGEPPLKALGAIPRRGNAACLELRFNRLATASNDVSTFGVLTAASTVELYALRPFSLAAKKMKRRLKRKREKGTAQRPKGTAAKDEEEEDDDDAPTAQDEVELIRIVECLAPRARSFAFAPSARAADIAIVVATRKNSVELHRIADYLSSSFTEKDTLSTEGVVTAVFDLPGHRSAVRSLALSHDGEAVGAASAGGVKLWRGGTCVRSLKAGAAALCVAFLRGDASLVVGAKDGSLSIVDIATGDVRAAVADGDGGHAHAGAVWALDVSEKALGDTVISGGADKEVKLWTLAVDAEGKTILKHARTLRVGEDVMALRFVGDSGNANRHYVAVCTLDACVRLLYADSLKFKVSLYGHKLPVLAVDGARDSELLATASADKTLKLWGIEFGDLRRSVLAHADAVTCVRFVAGTHYVVTCSKDGSVKQWDCDREEPFVQTLKRGHVGEVWALCVDAGGARLFSGGADRSVVSWRRTDEQVFASEEAELELEATLDNQDADKQDRAMTDAFAVDEAKATNGVVAVSRHTAASERRAERLSEALELAAGEEASRVVDPKHKFSPLMLGLEPPRYAMNRLALIRPAELEPALLLLPVLQVAALLRYVVAALLRKDFDAAIDVELCARVAVYALRVHHRAVSSHADLLEPLAALRDALRGRLARDRGLYGRNLAAIRLQDLCAAENRDLDEAA